MDSQRLVDLGLGVAVGSAIAYFLCKQRQRSGASFWLRSTTQGELDVTASINESWAPPEKQAPPFPNDQESDFVHLVPNQPDSPRNMKSAYFFAISAIVPRPIALVSTKSADGICNVAPFSYCGLMSHNPLTLVFAPCANRKGEDKDTLANCKALKECVFHIMSDWYVEAANHTCGAFAPSEDEFELSGLTKVPSEMVAPPRIAEAALQFECKVRNFHELKVPDPEKPGQEKVTGTMVIAEVVVAHVNKAIYDEENGTVHIDKLRPMSRLGGNLYGQTREVFERLRPGKEGAERAKRMAAARAAGK